MVARLVVTILIAAAVLWGIWQVAGIAGIIGVFIATLAILGMTLVVHEIIWR